MPRVSCRVLCRVWCVPSDGYSLDFIGRHFLHIVGQGLSCLASRFTIEDEDNPLAFLNHHMDSNEAVAQLRERATNFVAALSNRSSGDKKSAKTKKSRYPTLIMRTCSFHTFISHHIPNAFPYAFRTL